MAGTKSNSQIALELGGNATRHFFTEISEQKRGSFRPSKLPARPTEHTPYKSNSIEFTPFNHSIASNSREKKGQKNP
jgi:hypothetical protein